MKILLVFVLFFGTNHAYIPSIESSIYPTVENRQKVIHNVAKFRNANIVKGLIELGTDINPKNEHGQTPLHISVLAKSNSVNLFVENGAKVNAQDNWGNTPLGWAVFLDDENITEILIKNGANVNATFNNEITPLLMAVIFGNVNIVKMLVENGADLDAEFMGMKALHHAAFRKSEDYVRVLLSNGAKVNAKIADRRTALHFAAENSKHRSENVKLLLEYGADVDAKGLEGNTALHTACHNGDIDVIKLLIGYDAVVSIKNDNEQTPREFASDKAKEPNAKGNDYSLIDYYLKIAEERSKLLGNNRSTD